MFFEKYDLFLYAWPTVRACTTSYGTPCIRCLCQNNNKNKTEYLKPHFLWCQFWGIFPLHSEVSEKFAVSYNYVLIYAKLSDCASQRMMINFNLIRNRLRYSETHMLQFFYYYLIKTNRWFKTFVTSYSLRKFYFKK